MRVRALRPTDLDGVAMLWTLALAPGWPVLPDGLASFTAGHLAEDGGRVVGAVALDPAGSIPFVAVAPSHQRRGLGRSLVRRALAHLARTGSLGMVGVGSGGSSYIWPGVPADLPVARAFFASLGWVEDGLVADLVQDLQAQGVPDGLAGFIALPVVELALTLAGPDEMGEVLGFEATHFPQWMRWFREPGPDERTLIARDRTSAIVGTLLLAGPGRVGVFWPMLGDDCGTIGCVGVHPDHQSRGIGTAMVAHASRLLAARGVRWCHIGWVERLDFYGRLGYRVWRRYAMGRLPIRP